MWLDHATCTWAISARPTGPKASQIFFQKENKSMNQLFRHLSIKQLLISPNISQIMVWQWRLGNVQKT